MDNKDNLLKRPGFINRMLDSVERAGNKLPDPAFLFVILAFVVVIVSALCEAFGVRVSYETIEAATGKLINNEVQAKSLLSQDGIRHIFSSFISNFTGFFALGTVFVVILGVSVAEGTGLISAMLRKLVKGTPKRLVTIVVIFLGIMSNVASSTGYVVLVPLGAVVFLSFGRHPIAGLAATFAGVSGGWSANLLIGTNDPMFAGISTQAAAFIDKSYLVSPTANWYFMVASTFLITLIGTFVTEKIVEPRLGTYTPDDVLVHNVDDVSSSEKRGLKFALYGFLTYVAVILLLILPDGAILNQNNKILSSTFMSSIIPIMSMMFMIPGILFGIGSGVVKSDKDIINMMVKGIAGISSFLVLVFFAAQFVGYFNYSNLGIILSVKGADFLKNIGFVGLPMIVVFIVLTALLNIIIAVDSAKWLIMAPIFVPMFMRLGFSPELTQAVFRIGDSSTNIIAPLMPFFPLAVAFCQKYDKKFGIGSLITTMVPYSLAFLIGWILLFVAWFLMGLPLGPGAPLFY